MQLEVQNPKLTDQLLTTIVERTNYSLFEIGHAYKRLKSFDKLLSCIDKATEQKRPLSEVVHILEGK